MCDISLNKETAKQQTFESAFLTAYNNLHVQHFIKCKCLKYM